MPQHQGRCSTSSRPPPTLRCAPAALQFVRKLSGFNTPSRANEAAFEAAIEEVFQASRRLLESLETNAAPRDREIEAEKARQRNAERFGRPVLAEN